MKATTFPRTALSAAVVATLSVHSFLVGLAHADGGRGSDSSTLGVSGGAGGVGWLGAPGQVGGNGGSGFSAGGGGGAAGGGRGGDGGGPNGGTGGIGGSPGFPSGNFGHFGGGNNGGGGGGGGGWNGNGTGELAMNNTSPLKGGRGGPGGDAPGVFTSAGGGGGGAGGYGAVVNGVGTQSNSSSIIGGMGGEGGRGSIQSGLMGEVGDGGIGVFFTVPGAIFLNSGYIEGGASGEQGNIPADSGGPGVVGGDLTIINSGTILGGRIGIFLNFAPSITFTSGTNTLEIHQGSDIVHDVIAFSSADSFILGGSNNASFDAGQIGPAAKYKGFGVFRKTGTSTWALNGTSTDVPAWSVEGGVLSAASNSALGTATVSVASGATWAAQDNVTVSNNGTINGAGAAGQHGALSNLGGNNTFSGVITLGSNATIGSNSGTLNLTGPISAGSNQLTLNAVIGGTLSVSGSGISGTGGVVKSGNSQLYLAAPAGFTGGFRIDSGVVRVDHADALLNNVVTFNGAGVFPRLRLDATSATVAGLDGGSANTFVDNGSDDLPATLTINVPSGTQTYTGGMLDGTTPNVKSLGLVKSGAGTQVLTGFLSYSGDTTIDAGELRVGNNGVVTAWTPVLGNAGADIRGGRIVFAYSGSATSPQSEIVPQLDAGFDVNFASGRFRSSTAVANQFGLGWGDDGIGAFTVAYTRYGDANLDGTTNITDFALLAANFNQPGGWSIGDFNYDGTVSIGDFSLLASNFNQTTPRASVPEPSALVGLGALLGISAVRARRHHR